MSSFWNSPAWSLAKRPQSANTNKTSTIIPGPGKYNVSNQIGTTTIGCKIGTSNRNTIKNTDIPGPGKYQLTSKISSSKFTMSSKFKANDKESDVPGPGNYNVNQNPFTKSYKGFTMGAKYQHNAEKNTQPGPGSYSLQCNKNIGPKIGTSKRAFENQNNNVPGPGTYNYLENTPAISPHFSFGSGQRNQNHKSQNYPGPGQYTGEGQNFQNKGVTLGKRFNQGFAGFSNVPGPGQYQSIPKRPMSGTKIGKAQRNLMSKSFVPGPGAYDTWTKLQKNTAKIGSGQRSNVIKNDTPGPGAYDIHANKKGGISISGIKNKKNIQISPGPGSYEPNEPYKQRPCSAKFGHGKRTQLDTWQTPGPGSYNIDKHENPKFAYSKQNRSKELNSNEIGPGQYNIPSTIPSVPYYDPSASKISRSKYE